MPLAFGSSAKFGKVAISTTKMGAMQGWTFANLGIECTASKWECSSFQRKVGQEGPYLTPLSVSKAGRPHREANC